MWAEHFSIPKMLGQETNLGNEETTYYSSFFFFPLPIFCASIYPPTGVLIAKNKQLLTYSVSELRAPYPKHDHSLVVL